MSRITQKTDQLLIDPSKTQRLSVLQQEYQMKQQALEKATDLITLLSDELDNIKKSSSKTIERLKFKLQQTQEINYELQRRIRQMQQIISQKQSRIGGIPPLSKRSHNSDKRRSNSISRIKQDSSNTFSSLQSNFFRSLTNTLLNKIFYTNKQAQYLLQLQSQQLKQYINRVHEYCSQYQQINDLSCRMSSLGSKQELFQVIIQQQNIINQLKSHISSLQSSLNNLLKYNAKSDNNEKDVINLIDELKILLQIMTKCIKTKTCQSKSTDYNQKKYKQKDIESQYQYITRIQGLVSKQRYLISENKQLKNIIEGLLAHMKK